MRPDLRLSFAALATAIVLGACAGAPTIPLATDDPEATELVEPDETEPFETEPIETEEPESTLPGEMPGFTFAVDPSTYDDGNGWSVVPNVTLSGTGTFLLDGAYSGSDAARICGLTSVDLYGNPDAFTFEWPLDQYLELNDISFRADHLAPGTTTSAFHVSVLIRLTSGQSAPAFVFDTVLDPDTDSGTASMHEEGGHRILDVTAANDLGHHLTVHADCVPPSG